MKQLTILHIDFEKTWRGGQQQLFWLVEGLSKKGYRNFIICQPNSELHKRLKENDYNTIGFKILVLSLSWWKLK